MKINLNSFSALALITALFLLPLFIVLGLSLFPVFVFGEIGLFGSTMSFLAIVAVSAFGLPIISSQLLAGILTQLVGEFLAIVVLVVYAIAVAWLSIYWIRFVLYQCSGRAKKIFYGFVSIYVSVISISTFIFVFNNLTNNIEILTYDNSFHKTGKIEDKLFYFETSITRCEKNKLSVRVRSVFGGMNNHVEYEILGYDDDRACVYSVVVYRNNDYPNLHNQKIICKKKYESFGLPPLGGEMRYLTSSSNQDNCKPFNKEWADFLKAEMDKSIYD